MTTAIRDIKIAIPKPEKTEIIRPETKGSVKILRVTAFSHINNGCLPSVWGINRSVSSDWMIWAQRI